MLNHSCDPEHITSRSSKDFLLINKLGFNFLSTAFRFGHEIGV